MSDVVIDTEMQEFVEWLRAPGWSLEHGPSESTYSAADGPTEDDRIWFGIPYPSRDEAFDQIDRILA